MQPGIQQLTQTAYRKNVACSDSIFAGHEVISRFTKEGNHVFSCFYDLTSAFDTLTKERPPPILLAQFPV